MCDNQSNDSHRGGPLKCDEGNYSANFTKCRSSNQEFHALGFFFLKTRIFEFVRAYCFHFASNPNKPHIVKYVCMYESLAPIQNELNQIIGPSVTCL